MEWITLDTLETGFQYLWATGTFDVTEYDLPYDQIMVPENGGQKGTIVLYSFATEVPRMALKFVQNNPDFDYKIQYYVIYTDGNEYVDTLNNVLPTISSPDIYTVESAFVYDYTKGDMSKYAAAYEDIIPQFADKVEDAKIQQYSIDVGTRPGNGQQDGRIVGLGYQSSVGLFVYRRSIAKAVWGTDNPDFIKAKIGGGTGSWDNYFAAAEELKKKGYAITSSNDDLWYPVSGGAEDNWVKNNRLIIDPKKEAYMDIAKELTEKGYSKNSNTWLDPWFADMKATSGKGQVFGYFGPMWFVNYTLTDNSGRSDFVDSNRGESVNSNTVMEKIVMSPGVLSGQDTSEIIIQASEYVKGNVTSSDFGFIDSYWKSYVNEYAMGEYTREDAIYWFRREVSNRLGISPY